jgi:hypothetical protein
MAALCAVLPVGAQGTSTDRREALSLMLALCTDKQAMRSPGDRQPACIHRSLPEQSEFARAFRSRARNHASS